TEGEMTDVRAVYVEAIWIGELLLVSMGGADHELQTGSRRERYTIDFDCFGQGAARRLHGTLIAQRLLHYCAHQAWILSQLFPLLTVCEQRVQRVTDQIAGRFMPGEEQHDALCMQVCIAHSDFPIRADFKQQAQQIVVRLPAAAADDFLEVCNELANRGL